MPTYKFVKLKIHTKSPGDWSLKCGDKQFVTLTLQEMSSWKTFTENKPLDLHIFQTV